MAKIPKVLRRGAVVPLLPIVIHRIGQHVLGPHPTVHGLAVRHVHQSERPDLSLRVHRAHSRADQRPPGVQGEARALVPVRAHGIQHHVHLALQRREPLVRIERQAPRSHFRQELVVAFVGRGEDVGALHQGQLDLGQSDGVFAPPDDEHARAREGGVHLPSQVQGLSRGNVGARQAQRRRAVRFRRNLNDAVVRQRDVLGVASARHDCDYLVAHAEKRIALRLDAHFVDGPHEVGTGHEGHARQFVPLAGTNDAVLEGDGGAVYLNDDVAGALGLGYV
mmetsp:Transcript_30484/g.64762  ORF Transcript_30484/g.64762 Transcript_30484/m.64762 type:complete len:279 (-) Transcript_30484:188-1024(-)